MAGLSGRVFKNDCMQICFNYSYIEQLMYLWV